MALSHGNRRQRIAGGVFLLSLAALSAGPLRADRPIPANEAQTIIKKMEAVYQTANTFQGTVTVHRTGKDPQGKPASTTNVQQIRFKAPNLFYIVTKVSGTGSVAQQVSQMSQTIVSDGKTLTAYSPFAKKYAKRPAPPKLTVLELLRNIMPDPNAPDMTVSGGGASYLVNIKPQMPPNVPPAQKAQVEAAIKKAKPIQVSIDRKNYHLQKVSSSGNGGSQDASLSGQSFNGAIANSVFAFVPPAGATEAKQQQAPPPGGAPRRP